MSSDIHILNGISDILNRDNIKPGVDIYDLERRMMNGGLIQKVRDPQDKFNDEMKDMARKLGINFNDSKTVPDSSSGQSSNHSLSQSSSNHSRLEKSQPIVDLPSQHESGSEEEEEDDDDEEDPQPVKEKSPQRLTEAWKTSQSTQEYPARSYTRPGTTLHEKTLEQQRRAHINSVNAEMGIKDASFSFEKEKREDIKCQMLEQIDSLMYSLQEEDVDLSRIPRVDRNSSYEEVEIVLKILKHKNDRSRYCSFAEEFLLFGALGLEELFDGRRTWFGRYRPNLSNYHNVLATKLRRMRHDTSTIVGGLMQDYNIGAGARILLELVPNMVLYSKMMKQQHNQPGIENDEELISQASERIRNSNYSAGRS